MTIIKNGLIVDGTGIKGFAGDVVVEGDKITDVVPGSFTPEKGEDFNVIDATGCVVSPGFIDCHSHSDAYLVIEPDAPSKISQGVTTEINGQCGGSVAPRFGEARLSSDWASLLGERLTWHSLAEYRAVLEAACPAINTVQFVGHNTLRSSVIGYAGRTATADELKRMVSLLEQSLEEGGWGLTTGLIYQPGKYSTPEEVTALAKAAAQKGAFYATHMRSEGDRILEAIDEVIDLVKATGIRAEISHLKTSGPRNWHKIDAVLNKIETAIAQGLLLGSDRYPFCAAGTDLDVVFPDWAGEGAAKAECERLADPAIRMRLVGEINALERDWSHVMIGGVWHEDNKQFSGRTVAEICRSFGGPDNAFEKTELLTNEKGEKDKSKRSEGQITPGELICRILEKDQCRTGAFFFGMSESNLDKIYAQPWILPGSDASLRAPWGPLGADHPHPRAYGTMPEFYRRVRALGVSREEAVRRMTGAAAERFDIKGRGVLQKGAFADIVVWREDEFRNNATYLEPHRFASGVRIVMVNGSIPYREGAFTGQRAGRLLTR